MYFIASDFDGTILKNGEVTQADIDAIKKFRDKGYIFAICTGRPIFSVLEKLNDYGIPFDYIIGVNGAIAVDASLNLMFAYEIEEKAIPAISKILRQHQVLEYFLSTGFENERITDLDYEIEADKIKTIRSYYVDAQTIEKAHLLTQEINESLNHKQVIAYPNNRYVAIGMKSIHKGYGVSRLVQTINHKGHIVVIGDDYNDIPMFTRFDSYGIKTGYVDAIKFAKHHIDSVCDVIDNLMKTDHM